MNFFLQPRQNSHREHLVALDFIAMQLLQAAFLRGDRELEREDLDALTHADAQWVVKSAGAIAAASPNRTVMLLQAFTLRERADLVAPVGVELAREPKVDHAAMVEWLKGWANRDASYAPAIHEALEANR